MEREKEIYKVTLIGTAVNLFLLLFKFMAGILGHSSAMIADAFHSLSDFGSDIVILLFVRIASKPRDRDYEYGYGKYETLASLIIGIVLIVVALGLLYDGGNRIYGHFQGQSIEQPNMWALAAAILSIIFKEALYHYTRLAAKKLDSPVMAANAWHHRSDAITSIAALLGIGGAMLLGPNWSVLDPVACVIVSLFIFKAAIDLLLPCVNELMEKALPETEQRKIKETIMSTRGVLGYHHLRTRRIGPYSAIDAHVKMDGDISLSAAHDIASEIENRLREEFGSTTHIGIHMEPMKKKPSQ